MLTIHPQYIKDDDGNKLMVILTVREFDTLMEELEEMEDVRLYDEVEKDDTGELIPMEQAFSIIEANRK